MVSFLRSPRFGKAAGTTPASFPRVRSEGTGRVPARPRAPLSGAGAKRHGGGASRRRFACEAGRRKREWGWVRPRGPREQAPGQRGESICCFDAPDSHSFHAKMSINGWFPIESKLSWCEHAGTFSVCLCLFLTRNPSGDAPWRVTSFRVTANL